MDFLTLLIYPDYDSTQSHEEISGAFANIGSSLLTLLMVMSESALIAGIIGYTLAKTGIVQPVDYVSAMDSSKHPAFMADAFAHCASYLFGFLGSVVILVRVWRARGKIVK